MTPPPNALLIDPALEELCEAYAGGNLIVCAGPGVSTAAGLPDRKDLVEFLVERARARGNSPDSIAEIVDLLGRSQLADALSAAKQAIGAPEFHAVVERALDDRKQRQLPEVARALAGLAPRLRAVVTTNLDHLLERAFGGQWPALARAPGDLARKREFILKLHGTLLESDTWVLTREDYDRAMYADPKLQAAFTSLFNTCPILFVGYGPADDDFDALLARVRALSQGQPPRHFALMDRAAIRPGRRTQLEAAGLRLIPYDNPDGTHSAVIHVLRHLASKPTSASTGAPLTTPRPMTPMMPTPPASPPTPPPAPGPRMGTTLADDLREAIRSHSALFLVGSGVSVGATKRNPWASWQGLIEDGLAECEKVAGVPGALADTYRQQLKSNDLDALLSTAEFVHRKLDGPSGGDYRAWLRKTVGTLRAGYREVLEALRDLPGLLATTNYDGLLEEVTGLAPVTWRQRNELELVLNGREQGILHLHGHWRESESVVLSVRDYLRIVSDPHTQTVLRSSLLMKTVVFVGCGEGLADPNFGALLEWARGVFAGSERVHYRLAVEKDVGTLRQQHRADRIKVVSYGADFGALAPFLRSLA